MIEKIEINKALAYDKPLTERFEGGTVVKIDKTNNGMNTLIVLGCTLPFDYYTIFLKFDKRTYFDRDRYFWLNKDLSKEEISEVDIKALARNERILILYESQFKLLIELALADNEGVTKLSKENCELIYNIGFMTKEELNSIKTVF